MSKKRVHELAKEFGLENKDVIKALQQAGISVKTHSSSVYEDEARAVLEKQTAPKVETQPRRGPGLRIVKKKRKKKVDSVEAPDTQVATSEAAPAAPAGEAPAPVAAAVEEPAAPQASSEAAAAPAEPVAETPSSTEAAQTAPEPQAAPASEATPAPAAAAPEVSAPEAPAAQQGQPTSEAAQPAAQASPPAASADAAGAEASEPQPAAPPAPEKKASPNQAQVVRMIDRDKLLERVPSSRLGGGLGTGPGGGSQRFGKVTEFQVVNDPFGRGREMVAVGKDRKGPGGGKPGAKRGRTGGRRGGRQNLRERNMFPSRLRRKKTTKKGGRPAEATLPKASKRVVKMKETITLADLAHELGVKANEIIRKLMSQGMMVSINAPLDFDTATLVAADYDYTVESVAFDEAAVLDEVNVEQELKLGNLVSRPPVVTIMGHVDHGKTSLLDAIRQAKVAAGEAGGITQHIGAYSVEIPNRGRITFLDTPGHAAFTEMRARGANSTDIVVLVVAADDGVMPQTEEAIRHAQAAGVPIIVAINKIDRPEANPDRVTQELTQFNLLPEDWGGDTLFVKTSALKKEGLDELLDAILLQAEVLELKASEETTAQGVVVEAQLDKGRGPVATVLVQHGFLRRGDAVVVGEHAGRVRAMTNHLGQQVKEARPSDAVEIIGLEGVPQAGDAFNAVDTPEAAREVAAYRLEQRKAREAAAGNKVTLDELMKRMSGDGATELNIVLKADVQGTAEAVRSALEKLSTDEVAVKILHTAVGGITESDIMLATASQGIILGFNVRPDSNARAVAAREGVEIRTYSIIYEMIDDVRKAMEGLLAPDSQEKIVGRAEVRETFRISKVGTIAGCRVVEGKAQRSARARVLRDNVQVFDGRLASLKSFKDDAREVESGQECGIGLDGFQDVKNGDIIEFYEMEQVSRTLDTPAAAKRSAGRSVEAHA